MAIKTADRTLELIEVFAREQRSLTLSEIAERLAAPVSSTHGLIKALLERGYLYELGRRKGYYFTKKLAVLVGSIVEATPLLQTLEPVLSSLKDLTNETVVLAKCQGDSVVYLDVYESDHSVRFTTTAGTISPLHSTASGKALLGGLSEKEFLNQLSKLDLKSVTDQTVTAPEKLIEEINNSRLLGWYENIGQNTLGLCSISIPVQVGSVIYAVTVGGPEQRILSNRDMIIDALKDACVKISKINE